VRIGIVGGTGDIGEGMARRLSQKYDVILGSREVTKAITTSECTVGELTKRGLPCSCEGVCNQDAVDRGEIVILAVPFGHLESTVRSLTGFEGKIVVSPVNPMEKAEFFRFSPPPEGSAAMLARRLLPPDARLCTAFNTIAANRWKALDSPIDVAVPVCGDDAGAKKIVMDLARSIPSILPYDAGPLAASSLVESLTPLMINIARYNGMRDVGIQFR
jgi:NADPH-dependent F420 reductase